MPASHEQRGRAREDDAAATTLLKRAAAYLVSWRTKAAASSPGIAKHRRCKGAAFFVETGCTQRRALHVPMGGAFTGSPVGLVAVRRTRRPLQRSVPFLTFFAKCHGYAAGPERTSGVATPGERDGRTGA